MISHEERPSTRPRGSSSSDPRLGRALALVSRFTGGDWHARAVPGDAGDELDALLTGLNLLGEQVSAQLAARDDNYARAQEVMDVILALAAQNFTPRVRIREEDEGAVNGIAAGINMLAEEFAAAQEAVAQRTTELHDKTKIFELVITNMADGVIVMDEHGKVVIVNQAAKQTLAWEPDHVPATSTDAHPRSFLPDGETPFPMEDLPIYRALQGEATDNVGMLVRRPYLRGDISIVATGRPLRDEAGAQRGGLVVFRDVSAVRKAEAEAIAREAAEAASRAKSEFLANMSHEIRTPLGAVLGYADLLLDSGLGASDRVSHVQTIRRNGEHLLELLNDILDLSKIEAGKMTIESVACSPARIVAEVASLMRVRAAEKKLTLEVGYLTPVPETIAGDPLRLRQILTNLLSNAVKFTATGGVELLVRCDATDAARPRLAFCVSDTGIGLTAEQIGGLFQPFAQADTSTTRRFGGTGLGLVICQRFARLLGGDIAVASVPGQGSTFTLTVDTGPLDGIRMLADLEESGAAPPRPADPGAGTAALAGLTVLLAEDGYDNQRLISTYLRRAGAQVEIVENGLLAVDRARAAAALGTPFQVILMDMQMPELDGYGAAARLRAHGYRGSIVALTAHAMASDRARCLAAGCDDYLTKPVNPGDLSVTVRRAAGAASSSPTAVGRTRRPPPPAPLVSDCSDDPDLFADPEMAALLDVYVATLPEHGAALRGAADRHDTPELVRLAHQIKGSAGGYGFMPITEAAAELERVLTGSAGEVELGRRVADLAGLCERARARLP